MSQQINLFNPIFRKQKKYFSSVAMAQALGIICLGCLLLIADATWRMRAMRAQSAATDALLATTQQRLTDARVQFPPRAKSATMAAEIKAAQEELAMLQNAEATIRRGGFGDSAGFSGYFRAFARQSVPGLWLTDLDISGGGARIGVSGNTLQADLVPQFMRRLGQEPVMKGKAFSSLDIGAPAVVPGVPGSAPAPGTPPYLRFSLQSGGAPQPAVVAK